MIRMRFGGILQCTDIRPSLETLNPKPHNVGLFVPASTSGLLQGFEFLREHLGNSSSLERVSVLPTLQSSLGSIRDL